MNQTWIKFLLFILLFTNYQFVTAQSNTAKNAGIRAGIDAKRGVTDLLSKDGIARSREFIRTDSTYYVGWQMEGLYKANYAADYLGFKNAIEPLEKALSLIEKDYAKELSVRSADLMLYYPVYHYHIDYAQIAYTLMDCYINIEQTDSAYHLVRRAQKWNFQKEFGFQTYNYLAWITHRNRFYTSSKHAFLKDNINDNEALAQSYLDSALRKIKRNTNLNAFFSPDFEEQDRQSVYHYRAILYSYALNTDSALKYFNKMKSSRSFSNNNFGNFLMITGKFRDAEIQYELAKGQDMGDKRLQEWAYYTSIIDIYKGKTDKGTSAMKEMIQYVGSTPGYGWYNIALSRNLSYHGNIEASNQYITKAESFKELHIGTTLGQSHYDFSINLLKLINGEKAIQQIKFENKNWWYHPKLLWKLAKAYFNQYLLKNLVINQFANNPEREQVIYKLFASESTVSWDEIWYLLEDFTTNYFIKKYEEEVKNDKERAHIKPYFELFLAKFHIKKGNYEQAYELLNTILSNTSIDWEYEQLLLARTHEALIQCAKKLKNNNESVHYRALYQAFPQLIPFSEYTDPHFYLKYAADQVSNDLIKSIRSFNIEWEKDDLQYPTLHIISAESVKDKIEVVFEIRDVDGAILMERQQVFIKDNSKKEVNNIIQQAFKMNMVEEVTQDTK